MRSGICEKGNAMKSKDYLKSIRKEQKEIKNLQEQKEAIYFSLLPSGIRYDKDRIQVSPEDMLPDKVIKMSELTKEINSYIEHLEKNKAKALRLIRKIEDSNHRQVLVLYYLTLNTNGSPMSWIDVAELMGYSEDWIKHMHGDALKAFDLIYSK